MIRVRPGMSVVMRTRLATVAVAALATVVAAVVFISAWMRYTVDVRADELTRQVRAIAAGISAAGPFGDATPSELRERLFRVQAGLIGAHLALVDDEGRVFLSTSPTDASKRIAIDALGGRRHDGTMRTVRAVDGTRVLIVAAPLPDGGWLVGLQPVEEIARARGQMKLLLLVSGLVALGAAWVFGGHVAQRLTAPLVALEAGAEALAAGQWGHQVDIGGDAEIASLARSFNEMSSRLARAYEAQQHFVGDVSHELRTPITTIQGFARALTDGTVSDEGTRERFLGIIRTEAERLGEITTALLSLADLDAGRIEVSRAPVDVQGLSEALRVRHVSERVRVRVDDLAPDGARPLGDDARLLQVASALVNNAVSHSPDGGEVHVHAAADDRTWHLIVDDAGPGVPVAERERIFERFYRLDQERAAQGVNTGLGLAICRRLVACMHGTIRVDDSPLGGARFEVSLPRADRDTT